MGNQLRELAAAGQSVWLDNIKRSMFASGELQKLIDVGLRGMTSNPTIFENAIGAGTDYDAQLKDLIGTRARLRRSCSRRWRSKTSAAPAMRSSRSSTRPTASTATSRSKSRRRSRTTRADDHGGRGTAVESGRPSERDDQDSRHARVPGVDSRQRSPPASTSTSRCCSRSISTPPRPRPTSRGSKTASRPASRSTRSPRSRASSSRASTPRSTSCSTSGSPRASSSPTSRAKPASRTSS